ncbi:hypothetical protein D3C73_797480 [compost metagenome]
MSFDVIQTRQLAQLNLLKQILDEEGIPVTILEKSNDIAIHLLIANIQQDAEGRDRFLQFSFVPMEEEEGQTLQFLQIYSTLPFSMETSQRAEVAELLLELNTRLPLGHMGITVDQEIHYRYVYTLSSGQVLISDEVLELLSLFVYMLEMFGGVLERVATGTTNAASAIADLR